MVLEDTSSGGAANRRRISPSKVSSIHQYDDHSTITTTTTTNNNNHTASSSSSPLSSPSKQWRRHPSLNLPTSTTTTTTTTTTASSSTSISTSSSSRARTNKLMLVLMILLTIRMILNYRLALQHQASFILKTTTSHAQDDLSLFLNSFVSSSTSSSSSGSSGTNNNNNNKRRTEQKQQQQQQQQQQWPNYDNDYDNDETTRTYTQEQQISVPNNGSTLALLYPPGLLGGYRNQVLRFISFIVYAKQNNYTKILLPSIQWSTQLGGIAYSGDWYPIAFDWLFDVEYWNTNFAAANHLPYLVRSVPKHSDCWRSRPLNEFITTSQLVRSSSVYRSETHTFEYQIQIPTSTNTNTNKNTAVVAATTTNKTITINHLQRHALLQGALEPLTMEVQQLVTGQITYNPRHVDYSEKVQHCQNPAVYGGGRGAGKLWNDYLRYSKEARENYNYENHNNNNNNDVVKSSSIPFQVDEWVFQALQPAPVWRQVAQDCVRKNVAATTTTTTTNIQHDQKYVALHARIELEMMNHKCGSRMERNLTKIIQQVYDLATTITTTTTTTTTINNHTTNDDNNNDQTLELSGLFIAVSRDGMTDERLFDKYKEHAEYNIQILDILTNNNNNNHNNNNMLYKQEEVAQLDPTFQSNIMNHLPLFECGAKALEEYYTAHPDVPHHGALLEAVLNFDVALNADVFVGVADSSYSNSIFTTRYHQGKGDQNYRYTQSGVVERVENNGLPAPHGNCKGKKELQKEAQLRSQKRRAREILEAARKAKRMTTNK